MPEGEDYVEGYALDPSRALVHISEALRRTHYYRCQNCRDYLQVRQGDERKWYYAHLKFDQATPESRQCGFRDDARVSARASQLRVSPRGEAERSKQLGIELLHDHYTGRLSLVAILPAVQFDEVPLHANLDDLLQTITLTSPQALREVNGQEFHPSEAEVAFEVDPAAAEYRVDIVTDAFPRLAGSWTTHGLRVGDVFYGVHGKYRRLPTAEVPDPDAGAVMVIDGQAQVTSSQARILDLGKVRVAIYPPGSVAEVGSSPSAPGRSFTTDIILPAIVDPVSNGDVSVPEGGMATVALVPVQGRDPLYEVVTVPESTLMGVLHPVGRPDTPRLLSLPFPGPATHRLSVHSGGQHSYLQFRAVPSYSPSLSSMIENVIGFSVEPSNGEEELTTLLPYTNPGFQLSYRYRARLTNLGVVALGPTDLEIELEAFSIRGDETNVHSCATLHLGDAPSRIRRLVEDGAQRVTVLFGCLGFVTFLVDAPPWQLHRIDDVEIERRIRAMSLPPTVNWSLIRGLLGAEPGTPHSDYPSGIQKRVRRILMRLRREDVGP